MQLCSRPIQCWSGYISEGDRWETVCSQTDVRRSESDYVEAYYNRTCHLLSRCTLNTHMHSGSATKCKPSHLKHQAINTLRKIQINNPLTSSINAFSNRMWHHVSMLLKSKRRSPTLVDRNSTSQMLCAAGNPKKQAPPTVVMWSSHT